VTPAYLAQRSAYALQMRAVIDAAADPPPSAPVFDFPNFMEAWQTKAAKCMADDPTLKSISELLSAHVPQGEESFVRTHMHLRVAGARIEIQTGARRAGGH
jgi:hypothetical protein